TAARARSSSAAVRGSSSSTGSSAARIGTGRSRVRLRRVGRIRGQLEEDLLQGRPFGGQLVDGDAGGEGEIADALAGGAGNEQGAVGRLGRPEALGAQRRGQ